MTIPNDTIYSKVKFKTGCGMIRLFIGYSPSLDNRVIDVYTVVNSSGGCQLNIQGEVIAISKFLRTGGNVDTLLRDSNETGACPSYQFQRGKGNTELFGKSCFNGIVKSIVEFRSGLADKMDDQSQSGLTDNSVCVSTPPSEVEVCTMESTIRSRCPGCDEIMIKETGCWQCKHCGFSKCE